MQNDLKKFLQMLKTATELIEEKYFRLPVAGDDSVYRERVYCYELYNQLRCIWGNFNNFRLCGEVDKSNHKWFKEKPYSRAKPDLLVHKPGSMDNKANLAVIEVKKYDKRVSFKHDLKKLTWFCKDAKYFPGIFLVYGEAEGDVIKRKLLRSLQSSDQNDIQRQLIQVFHHAHVRDACMEIPW